jgi:glycosyltransferase involved in cell wall biosynthesis
VRILFVADGRSPTTISWLSYWIDRGDEVHLISTYACDPIRGLSSIEIINTAYSSLSSTGKDSRKGKILRSARGFLRVVRSNLGPLNLKSARIKYLKYLEQIHPDIVHALRIPFEGLLAQVTPKGIPLVISIWGNDITLHAKGSPIMAFATRKTLQRADALFADTRRDIRLGRLMGLSKAAQTLEIPGAGGIKFGGFDPAKFNGSFPENLPDEPIIVNPRGQRPGSLRQDKFFLAVKYYIESGSAGIFVCPSLKDDTSSRQLIKHPEIQDRVYLWPKLPQPELWYLFSKARVYASPCIHDGTPNSLLEAIALGCFPVTGNIESMKEWIVNGENGLLVDANDPRAFADAMIQAINNPALRSKAAKINADLVARRANYQQNMEAAREIYFRLVKSRL